MPIGVPLVAAPLATALWQHARRVKRFEFKDGYLPEQACTAARRMHTAWTRTQELFQRLQTVSQRFPTELILRIFIKSYVRLRI